MNEEGQGGAGSGVWRAARPYSAVIGVLFLFLWVYVISVRRTVLGGATQ